MKVDIVNQNFNSAGVRKTGKAAQSFTGIPRAERELMDLIYHKKAILKMKKLEWLKGEIGGILLTALGTGAVAPIFIGFNPFVKTKKDATPEEKQDLRNTKLYTAMRQPISAALAILFQASIQKYIDKGLDSIFNNPNRAKNFRENLDQQDLNTETFIKANVKKELKEKGIKKPSLLSTVFGKKKIRNGEKLNPRAQYNLLVNDRVEYLRGKQLQKIADKFLETGEIRMGARALDNKTLSELINSQIGEYIKTATKLQKTDDQIAMYAKKADTFINYEKRIRKMFADNPWEQIKNTKNPNELKQLYDKTTQMLENIVKNEPKQELKDMAAELLKLPEDLRAYKVNRTLKRIDYIKDLCKDVGGYTHDKYIEALVKRNDVLAIKKAKLSECVIKNPEAIKDGNAIKTAINRIVKACSFKEGEGLTEAVLRNTNTFSDNTKELRKKIFKDVTNKYKKLVENNYKSWNQVSKILVGVFITLPITCTALNWVYPRFMEIFFPKLAGAKKKSGAAQQQGQNAQQAQKVGGDK